MFMSILNAPILPFNDNVAFFCGSGISFDPPSSLPKWDTLSDTILKNLCVVTNNEYYSLIRSKLDLYILTQVILERMEDTANLFSEIYNVGEPNINHLSIAHFSKNNNVKVIVTTNFDNLLERALDIIGVQHNIIIELSKLNAQELKEDKRLLLIKIHGSANEPSSIVGSFKSIQRLNFNLQIAKTFEPIFNNYKVIFVGYSGADFRVNKNYLNILSAAPSAKGLIWNFYSKNDASPANIDHLKERYGKKFEVSYGPVSDLLKTKIKIKLANRSKTDNYEYLIEKWINANSVNRIYYSLSALLEWCDEFEKANKMYQEGLKRISENSDPNLSCQITLSIGENFQKLTRFDEALLWYKNAYKQSRSNGFTELANRAMLGIARSELVLGNFTQAISLLNNVKRYANAVNDKELFLDSINVLGGIYTEMQMYKEAASILEDCVKIRLEMGDFYKALSSKQNLATAYLLMGCIEDALDLLKEAVDEYEKYDIQLDLCMASINYGFALSQAGYKSKAEYQLQRGLEISEKLGNQILYKEAVESLKELKSNN